MNPKLVSRTKWLVAFEAVVGVVTALWAATWPWSVWALAVGVAALATVAVSVAQWVRLGQLDYGAPVLTLLRQLEALQQLRIRSTQLAFVVGSVLWLPLVLMAVGVPIQLVSGTWLVMNIAVTLAVLVPLAFWLGRKSSLRDDLTGRSLAKARDAVAELAAFEIS